MKDKVDGFIGRTFPTPKGGVLTVTGVIPKVKGKATQYECKCSICSKDNKLFPSPFISLKSNLTGSAARKPSVPCGCGKYLWSKDQFELLIKRKCKETLYKFVGFDADWKGAKTKLIMYCIEHDNLWNTTDIDHFLSRESTGCTYCKGNKISLHRSTPVDTLIERFMATGAFKEGTTFSKNTTRKTSAGVLGYWDSTCPVCSSDEYVKAGLCSGIFTSLKDSLLEGNLPCRCSKYIFNSQQQEFRIKRVCAEERLTWISWKEGEYTNDKSKFLWECKEGHLCDSSTVTDFVNRGYRCDTCARKEGTFGYYPDRVNETDNLYLLLFRSKYETFIKIGRSFDVSNRIKDFLKYYDIEVLTTYQSNHQTVYDLEQDIHSYLNHYHYTPSIDFGGSVKECFKVKALDKVEDIFYDLSLPIGFIR